MSNSGRPRAAGASMFLPPHPKSKAKPLFDTHIAWHIGTAFVHERSCRASHVVCRRASWRALSAVWFSVQHCTTSASQPRYIQRAGLDGSEASFGTPHRMTHEPFQAMAAAMAAALHRRSRGRWKKLSRGGKGRVPDMARCIGDDHPANTAVLRNGLPGLEVPMRDRCEWVCTEIRGLVDLGRKLQIPY